MDGVFNDDEDSTDEGNEEAKTGLLLLFSG
jgi:hypothetical protein